MKKNGILLFAAAALFASCSPKTSETTKIYGELPPGLNEVELHSETLDTVVRADGGKFVFETPTDPATVIYFACGRAEAVVVPDGTKLDLVLADSSYVTSRAPEISVQERLNDFSRKLAEVQDYEGLKNLALQTINAEKDNVVGAIAFQSAYVLMTDDELGQALRTLSPRARKFDIVPVVERIYNARKATSTGCYFRDFSVRTITGYDYGVPVYSNISLSDYAGMGQFVLLYFWNPDDENSISQIPFIKRVKDEFGRQGLEVVSVALYADAEYAMAAADELDFDWVALNGADDSVGDLYGLAVIPEVVYIAPDGTILDRGLFDEDIYSAAKHYFEQLSSR